MLTRALIWCALVLCGLGAAKASADPVYSFIVAADSLAKLEDPQPLADLVEREADLVAAAVGQLLDIAFQIEIDDPAAAEENVALAARLADVHQRHDESAVAAALVAAHRGWSDDQRAVKRRARELEEAAAAARKGGDSARDVEALEEAARLYASIDDQRALAVNLGTQGVAHWYRGDWQAVKAAYTKALEARRAIGDRILEGRTLNGLGSAHFQQNDFAGALDWYLHAIALRERTRDVVGLATSLTYAANCKQAMGQLLDARLLLERAVPVLEASGDDRRRIEVQHTVGVLHRNMRRTADAVEALQAALQWIDAAPEFEPGIRLDLAGALREQGRSRESIQEIARVEGLLGDEVDASFLFRLKSERGQAALALGDLERGTDELETARDLAVEIGAPELIVLAESNLALAQSMGGEHEEALATALRAREQASQAKALLQELHATQVAASALDALGRDREALALADETLDDHADADPVLLTELSAIRGNALTSLDRFEEARTQLREVRASLVQNGRTELEWVPLMGIGDSFEADAPDSARAYYELAFDALERHRVAAGSGAVRTSYLSDQRGDLYEGVVQFYAEHAQGPDHAAWSQSAFVTAERARARGLLELVTRSVTAERDPEIVALLDELYALDEPESAHAGDRQRLQEELARLYDARMAVRVPWLEKGGRLATPGDLGQALDDETAVLVYSVGAEATWVWAVDSTDHLLRKTASRSDLQSRVLALRRAIRFPGMGDKALAKQAHALYASLVEPVAERLRGKKRLWIVPDGVLFELPFELLLHEDAGESPDWREAPYLARRFDLGYAPSATVLLQISTGEGSGASAAVVAVGDPDFSSLAPIAGAEEPLPPLPASRREIEVLRDLRGDDAQVLLGSEATESALRQRLTATHPSIVHLATHGLVDREEPALTSVALSRDPDGSDDGYLYTLEILALPLETELVVLSACDTGRGKLERGEGTVGLTRSFLAAGARRVVSSLWPVADASTSRLMRSFYGELSQQGSTVEGALNRARAALWSDVDTAHPYYWAPFVLMGSSAPLPESARG